MATPVMISSVSFRSGCFFSSSRTPFSTRMRSTYLRRSKGRSQSSAATKLEHDEGPINRQEMEMEKGQTRRKLMGEVQMSMRLLLLEGVARCSLLREK